MQKVSYVIFNFCKNNPESCSIINRRCQTIPFTNLGGSIRKRIKQKDKHTANAIKKTERMVINNVVKKNLD